MNNLLQKIHTRGYWQVIIRPARFAEKRIEDIAALYPILQKTYVSLRGWDYPHLDIHANPRIDIDWIEQQFEWEHYLSLWRFCQSGQFFHSFGMPIDWRDKSHFWPADENWKSGVLLGVGDTVATFTEILEFAARLSLSQAGDDQMHIDITGGNLAGRSLFVDSPRRWPMHEMYRASIEKYPCTIDLLRSDLVARPREIALELATELFKRFSWSSTAETLRSWQDELKR